MKHHQITLGVLVVVFFGTPSFSQDYNPSTGATAYPNGTVYLPAGHGRNQTDTDIVEVHTVKNNPNGGYDSNKRVIPCDEYPDACKEALETAADDAEEGQSSNIKDGCGSLEDWGSRPGEWPTMPPIFFPDKGPGLPIPPRTIGQHTDRITRQIR